MQSRFERIYSGQIFISLASSCQTMKKYLVRITKNEHGKKQHFYLNQDEMREVWWNVDQLWQEEEGFSDEEREALREAGLSNMAIFQAETELQQKQRYWREIQERTGNGGEIVYHHLDEAVAEIDKIQKKNRFWENVIGFLIGMWLWDIFFGRHKGEK
ncbi:hypothetical protein AGMMS50249_6830 [candidate division SR1 bacterium]|nr:hypothetical protein AGMMS50249_6830 [candidate division SR1 bacterium]